MSLLDDLLSGGKKLGTFAVDTLASGVSDPYKQNLMDLNRLNAEDAQLQKNRAYMQQALGNEQQNSGLDSLTQELLREEGANPNQQFIQQQGQGYLGSDRTQADKLRYASQMQSAPSAQTRQSGGSILNQLLQPRDPQRAVSFQDYQQFNPQQQQQFDQFKGRDQQQRAVGFDQYQGFDEQQRKQFDQFKGRDGVASFKDRAGMENTLRDDFRTENSNFKTLNQSFNRINNAAQTGAGDLAIVFSYMKMLDPTSTVREGEAASVYNTTGIGQQVLNWYNSVRNGQRLPPEARANIQSQAGIYMDQATTNNSQLKGRYVNNAIEYGLNPRNIVSGYEKEKKTRKPVGKLTPYKGAR